MKPMRALAITACLMIAAAGSAFADPGAEPDMAASDADGGERPWAEGVELADQEKAVTMFREANDLLRDSLFVKAVEVYRGALSHWDHPAIHYNLALALLNLDQPIAVYSSLQEAMRYGAAPLGQDKYEHARSYMALVRKQLANVDIRCEVEGAQVTMDGRLLFVAPGRYEGLVRAGTHTLVAERDGYLTTSETLDLPAGETTTLRLALYTAEELTTYRRRWSAWQPWAVVGAGALVGAAGGLLHWRSGENFETFDEGIEACGGCQPPQALAARRDRAELQQYGAVAAYAAGGAALVTGLALVYVNRPRPYRLDAREIPRVLTVAPVLGPDEAGFAATFRF